MKAKYVGVSVAEVQRLQQWDDENRRLKKLMADPSLDKDMPEAVIAKRVGFAGLREEMC